MVENNRKRPDATRRRRGTVIPFRKVQGRSRKREGWSRSFILMMIAMPLGAFTAVFIWDGGPMSFAMPVVQGFPAGQDREAAGFERCWGPVRNSCVVDGDTFWYRSEKIRIADINTPEVSEPGCDAEAELGEQATERLIALLNQGPFRLESVDRDRDRYGRLLRTVTRNGHSLGEQLVAEGLAERWQGRRGNWCARLAGSAGSF